MLITKREVVTKQGFCKMLRRNSVFGKSLICTYSISLGGGMGRGRGVGSGWALIRINSVSIIFTSSAAVGFYREATHMITGVNVGASVGKDE